MKRSRIILSHVAWALLAIASTVGCGGSKPANAPPTATPDQAAETPADPSQQEPEHRPVFDVPATADQSDGWIRLFDGQSLFGWSANSDADWRVENNAIVVSSGEKGLLVTTTRFDNYILRLDFQSDPETNSGVFLRTPRTPTAPDKDCYELNIAPADNPFPTGSLVGRQKVEGDHSADKDTWRTYEVTVNKGAVQVQLDGKAILSYTDPAPLSRGFIGLQLNEGRVAFRDIRLKPLGLESIFNGENLDGWVAPPSPAEFEVNERGELQVRNGRGHLESMGTYGNFVLQLECETHAANLNSGIFFRCIPGSTMDGYESQIHNGCEEKDRSKPLDHGTGGIFRRQAARLVVADDMKWFQKTIIADGAHMAVWVNGFQVTDWTDERAPNENPRRGLRTAPGSIMIQGHDPTTDLTFRNLRIREFAKEPPTSGGE